MAMVEDVTDTGQRAAGSEDDAQPAMDWDPFRGTVPERHDAFTSRKVAWTGKQKLIGAAALTGLPVLFGGAALGIGWSAPLGFAMIFGFGMPFSFMVPESVDGDLGTLDLCRRAAVQLAGETGRSVALIEPSRERSFSADRSVKFLPAETIREKVPTLFPNRPDMVLPEEQLADLAAIEHDHHEDRGHTLTIHDPDAHAAYRDIGPLVSISRASGMPTLFMAVFRWRTDAPFWSAVALVRGAQRRPRKVDGKWVRPPKPEPGAGEAYVLTTLVGRPLDRAKGVRAVVSPRLPRLPFEPGAELTLGGRFDATFKLKVEQGTEREVAVLLAPAIREALVKEQDRHPIEAMIAREALFVRGSVSFQASATDPTGDVARAMGEHVDRLARAITA